jgi:general secretion pathway protein I
MKYGRGFTLIEVLVALVIVAVALSAILASSGRTAVNAASLRDSTLAHWVAENQLAELRLAREWPDTGSRRGEAEMGGREWHWEMRINSTDDPDLRRVDVIVRSDRDAEGSLARLSGFIGRPQQAALPGAGGGPEGLQ